MARHFAWALTALLLVAPAAAQQPPQQGQQASKPADDHRQGPPKWWIDPKLRAELGITDPQSAAVEAVWSKAIPKMRDLRQQVDDLDNTISQMVRDAVDEPTLIAKLDRVESLRGELNKSRTLMLYRMNRVLTPDQRVKLRAMWERDHGSDRRR